MKKAMNKGNRIMLFIVLAIALLTISAAPSIIQNFSSDSRLNLVMKIQYYNSSTWIDERTIYDNWLTISSENVSLTDYWNNTGWNTSSLSYGYGTYRAYAALLTNNGGVVITKNGTLMQTSSVFNYLEYPIQINSIMLSPDDDNITNGTQINPIESSNITITMIANISNTTSIDTCKVTIFNESQTESNAIFIKIGTIQYSGIQTQCNITWEKEYWRNYGDWNISLTINTTNGESANSTNSYYYNPLTSHYVNSGTISFNGTAGTIVNSSAWPLIIKNTGNTRINISLMATNFTGQTNSNYYISPQNVTFNESTIGTFVNMQNNYKLFQSEISPKENRNLYMKGTIPLGTKTQTYEGNITIMSE